jgi:hypothetical protein
MRLLLALAILICACSAFAAASQRLPLSHRTNVMQGAVSDSSKHPFDHAWKLGLLGLAALSFLIRKRL